MWKIGSGTRTPGCGQETQPASALWSASVLPGKVYEAGDTEGPPGRRWKKGPPPLCLQPNCAAVGVGSRLCPFDLPGDHHGGQVGGGGSRLQLVWPLFCGRIRSAAGPEAGLSAVCCCVPDSDPALPPARLLMLLPTWAPACWPQATTQGTRGTSVWSWGSVWRPGGALRANQGLSHRRGLGLCPAPRPG